MGFFTNAANQAGGSFWDGLNPLNWISAGFESLKGWVLGLLPGSLGAIWAFMVNAIALLVACLGHLVKFPVINLATGQVNWSMDLILTIPIWLVWYALLTQPKRVDEVSNKFTEGTMKVANYIWDIIFPGGKATTFGLFLIVLMLAIGRLDILVFALVFRKETFNRLVITLGLANLLSSREAALWVAKKLTSISSNDQNLAAWTGWGIILAIGIVLLFIWWFRDPEYKDHARRVIREKGWIWGVCRLSVEDFLPVTSWKCKACGYGGNEIEKDGPTEHCAHCGCHNPNANWKCKCGRISKPDHLFCQKCGDPRPAPKNPPPAHTPPPETEETECPSCGDSVPKGQAHCGNCGAEMKVGEVIE